MKGFYKNVFILPKKITWESIICYDLRRVWLVIDKQIEAF